jgi:autotransporter-associated beta strand protein
LIAVDTASVSAGGARIDTQGFAVTIAEALLENGTSTGGGLTKLGTGRLTLSGSNAYTGSTTISGGTLALGAAGSFANSSAIIVGSASSAGAVLDLTAKTGGFSIGAGQLLGGGGTVRLASSGTLNVLGTFSPGNSPGLFTYSAGTTVLSGTTLMEIFGTSRATSPSHGTGFYDAVDLVNNGTLQFGGMLTLEFSSLFANNTTFDLFTPAAGSSLAGDFTGVNVGGSFYTGLSWNQTGGTWKSSNTVGGQSLEFSSATGQLVIVPEPAGLALAGIGIAAAASAYRRRRS